MMITNANVSMNITRNLLTFLISNNPKKHGVMHSSPKTTGFIEICEEIKQFNVF